MTRTLLRIAFAATLFVVSTPTRAQITSPRFGLGVNALLSSEDGFGLGLRGRLSVPLNADVSLAGDLGFTAFVIEGRDDATYLFDPQFSIIVTLPGVSRAPYVLAGVGGYIPLDEDRRGEGGPTIHLGIGWVRPLSVTTLYYEFNPALIILREKVAFAFPLRVGVIF